MNRPTVLAAIGLLLSACARNTPPAPPSPVGASTASDASPVSPATGAAAAVASPAPQSETPVSAEPSARARAIARISEAVVYFSFDAAELDENARLVLADVRLLLEQYPDLTVRLEGHADDRGSDEYNLSLGMRRAAAVQRWLTQRGAEAGRMSLLSFGEERPVLTGDGEPVWSKNRRVNFVVSSTP
jgi:peptidoglycan-associated lipoprotein